MELISDETSTATRNKAVFRLAVSSTVLTARSGETVIRVFHDIVTEQFHVHVN